MSAVQAYSQAFAKTVASFDPSNPTRWYFQSDALHLSILLCLLVALLCFIGSTATGNYSRVDQLWSVIPVIYAWHFALHAGLPPRAVAGATLITAWGVRLTYNFARKGGYSGEEDYRWPALREIIPNPLLWALFNFFFISIVQNVILLGIIVPVHFAARATTTPSLTLIDAIYIAAFLALLVFESIADEQQWRFQNTKYAARAAADAPGGPAVPPHFARGFLTAGLFSMSRHPNFFAEQAMWVVTAVWGAVLSGGARDVTPWLANGWGALALVALFQGSTSFTEELTLKKYSAYAKYQKTVSRLIPWVPREIKWE